MLPLGTKRNSSILAKLFIFVITVLLKLLKALVFALLIQICLKFKLG